MYLDFSLIYIGQGFQDVLTLDVNILKTFFLVTCTYEMCVTASDFIVIKK